MINVSGTTDELNDRMRASVLPVTVFIAIETVVGFFGNILVLLVYFKRYRRINFRYFVLTLAILDLTSCCTTLPGDVFSQLNWYRYEHGWICKVKSFFNGFAAWGSASVLLIVAVDRYRKVCHPLRWQIRYNVAFRLCVCCFLTSLLVASPIFLLWGKMTYIYVYEGKNVTVSVCDKSGDYANTLYPLIYVWCFFALDSIMMIVAMILNFKTARKLFWGHSATPVLARDFSSNTGTSTMMTSESLDKLTDDTTGACKNKTSDIIHDTNKYLTRAKTELNVSRSSSKSRTTHGLNKNRQITNNTGDTMSTPEQTEDNSPGCVQAVISNKSSTNKYKSYRKSKTMIMLVLTSIFTVTMTLYIILTTYVAKPGGILKYMPDAQKAVFFFFWRLYYINAVINPILYGFMDARFRSGLKSLLRRS